jgi:hypothetical protein
MGTPSYMAPEQAAGRNRELTTATDVYGLGAVLYELLTGRQPFHEATHLDTLLQVLREEPARPSQLRPGLAPDLETICLKCLRKEPKERYATAEALGRDLEHYLKGEPIEGRNVSALQKAVRWVRRRPAPAALAVVSVLAVLALVCLVVGLVYNAELGTINGQLEVALHELKEKQEEADRQRVRANRAEDEARRYLYLAYMPLIQQAERDNQPGRVIQLLRRLIPERSSEDDFRQWEFYHLWRKYNGEESRLHGHTGAVAAVAFSPDDKLLASASTDRTIKLWDTVTGKECFTLAGHRGAVTTVAFSPDGKRLVSGSADTTVKIWDTATGKELQSLQGHTDSVTTVAFSPNNLNVASGSEDCTVRVWNRDTGRMVTEFKRHNEAVNSLAFSPNGTWLASTGKADVQIWKPLTGEVVKVRKIGNANPDSGRNNSLAFSPDGQRLAVGYTAYLKRRENEVEIIGRVEVWDLTKDTSVRVLNHQGVTQRLSHIRTGVHIGDQSCLRKSLSFSRAKLVRKVNGCSYMGQSLTSRTARMGLIWLRPPRATRR